MEKNLAIETIRKTFQNSFNKESFVYFIKSLLNHIEPAPFIYRGNFIPDAYKPYIETLERIGKYQDRDDKKIDLLIVHLKKETSLERARTMQRNFIAWYLNGSQNGMLKDAALVAFISPNLEDWRFSLVKMDYRLDASGEKVKIQQELTPARRFSFLVGKTESSHTAQSRLVPILQDDEKDPTLKDLENAFSVEKVTEEFYQEYKKLFDRLCEELDKNRVFQGIKETKRIDTANFAKKLLGQIVFLYFIQKKGWLGVPMDKKWSEGNKSFLRHLSIKAKEKNENFFNNYLEKLFYNTLNNPCREEVGSSYSKYFECRIPFLNGGLFEPMKGYNWRDSLLFLENDLFFNSTKTKEGNIGTGILDVFDRYNFTVKEDEPLEKEVAIDPEMLGKVFENLLEEHLRRGKGTYYTPREIVHYMCRESLINYLSSESKIDQEDIKKYFAFIESTTPIVDGYEKNFEKLDVLLKNIKVCDPACGSGAFLIGMLQDIVKLRLFLQNILKRKEKLSEYQLKKETIQNCIYGVDIDPGAVEIAQLRLWLSLVVDYELEEIEPLPNLDYKIMQGNSLLEELVLGDTTIKLFDPVLIQKGDKKMKNLFEEEKQGILFDNQLETRDIIEQLDRLRKRYFRISDLIEKQKVKRQIEDIEQDLVEQCVNKETERLDSQLKNIGKYIAPGVGLIHKDAEKIAKTISLQVGITEMWREFSESGVRPFFLWHLYFADVFQKKGGFDVIIGNPPYNAKLSETEKKLFKSKYESVRKGRQDTAAIFVERGGYLGNDLSTITYILPYRLFSRKRNHGQFQIYTLHNFSIDQVIYLGTNIGFTSSDEFMVLILKNKADEDNRIKIVFKPRNIERPETFRIYTLSQLTWRRTEEINLNTVRFNQKILQKIRRDTVLLGHICEVKDGIVPFVREKLLSDYKKDNRYVKFVGIAGQYELEKYYLRYKNLYLCYDIEEAKKYVKDPKELSKVQLREKSIFLHRKILTAQDSAKIKGTIDNEKLFVSNSLHSTFLKKEFENSFLLEYILALLNSKPINYFHDSLRLKGVDLHPQILISDLKKIPIKKTPKSQQKLFVSLVDKILALTGLPDYLQNEAEQKKVKEYEQKIDQLVYKLYGLTPEEIKMVENFNPN